MSEADRILDEALSSYAACEPRAGLSGRVLARVEAEKRTRKLVWWAWAAVPAMLCCAIVVSWPPRAEHIEIALRTPAVPAEAYVLTPVQPEQPIVKPRHRVRPLLAVAQIDGDAALWLMAKDKPLDMRPIEIRPIEIEPLREEK